jgi:MFS family permease
MNSDKTPASSSSDAGPWWRELSRYQWFVLLVASMGWMFDTMDQQLFNLNRTPALRKLLAPAPGVEPDRAVVEAHRGPITSIFLIGWGTGGIIFGVLGDLIGRARSMIMTILLYAVFTGLVAFSQGFWDFALYMFLTGVGVGGQFGVGVALVAEVMPDRARPFALSTVQALSAVGNIIAALMGIGLPFLARAGVIGETWRAMFLIGASPALLAIFVFLRLKEPERWQQMTAKQTAAERFRSYFGAIFSSARWAKNALIGLLLASSGIIGLWAIGVFSNDLQRKIYQPYLVEKGMDVTFYGDVWAAVTLLMFNIGAVFGIYAFSKITHYLGRRLAFAIAFVLAMISTALVFLFLGKVCVIFGLSQVWDIFWMVPIMGFFQLALFGGYAIYFPELFPTRLRSTGTSFCYNLARFVAASGPFVLTLLTTRVYADYPEPDPFRYAGVTMCLCFLIGLAVLPFAPETRGQPLPED